MFKRKKKQIQTNINGYGWNNKYFFLNSSLPTIAKDNLIK